MNKTILDNFTSGIELMNSCALALIAAISMSA